MKKALTWMIISASALLGGGSLLAFGAFLYAGGFSLVALGLGPWGALGWNSLISLIFFFQHSGMIRFGFRQRLIKRFPEPFFGAVYSIAAGASLALVMVLWQPVPAVVYSIPAPWAWLLRAAFFVAGLGFIWSVSALGEFDGLGIRQAIGRREAPRAPTSGLTVSGPYHWIRHPLYFLSLLMIWACPVVTADRLLFNLLWSLWIVIGARLEERDLETRFGDAYAQYRRRVPMLIPWRW